MPARPRDRLDRPAKPGRAAKDRRRRPMPMYQDFSKYQEGVPPGPAAAPAGCVINPDTRRADRLPPGQKRTPKWPVLHASVVPAIDLATWRLRVFGEVERELTFTWEE